MVCNAPSAGHRGVAGWLTPAFGGTILLRSSEDDSRVEVSFPLSRSDGRQKRKLQRGAITLSLEDLKERELVFSP